MFNKIKGGLSNNSFLLFREILLADACTVVLNKWNPYYYELGMYLRKFNNRDCEMIIDSLLLVILY